MTELTDAERTLIEQARELARGPFRERAPESDATGRFGHANAEALRELGVPGMLVAESSGGLGASGAAAVRVIEQIAWGRRFDGGRGEHAFAGHGAAGSRAAVRAAQRGAEGGGGGGGVVLRAGLDSAARAG